MTSNEKELEAKAKRDKIFSTLNSILLTKDTYSLLEAVEDLLPDLVSTEKELISYLEEGDPEGESSSNTLENNDFPFIGVGELKDYMEELKDYMEELKPVLENKKPCKIKKSLTKELLSQLRDEIKRRETSYDFSKDYWNQIASMSRKVGSKKFHKARSSAVRVRKPSSCYLRAKEAVIQGEWEIATFYLSRLLDLYDDFEPMVVKGQTFDVTVYYRCPSQMDIVPSAMKNCLNQYLDIYNRNGVLTQKVEVLGSDPITLVGHNHDDKNNES